MKVRTMHNNERATQVRLLRQLFFSPTGFPEWCLAKNVIPLEREHGAALATSNATNLSIRLTRMWAESINTVENLQALLMSCKLYRNPVCGVCGPIGRIRIRTYAPNDLHRTAAVVKNVNYCSRSPLSDGIVLLPQSTMLFPPKIPGVLRQSYEYVARTDSEGVQGPRRQRRRCLGTTSRKFEQRG